MRNHLLHLLRKVTLTFAANWANNALLLEFLVLLHVFIQLLLDLRYQGILLSCILLFRFVRKAAEDMARIPPPTSELSKIRFCFKSSTFCRSRQSVSTLSSVDTAEKGHEVAYEKTRKPLAVQNLSSPNDRPTHFPRYYYSYKAGRLLSTTTKRSLHGCLLSTPEFEKAKTVVYNSSH